MKALMAPKSVMIRPHARWSSHDILLVWFFKKRGGGYVREASEFKDFLGTFRRYKTLSSIIESRLGKKTPPKPSKGGKIEKTRKPRGSFFVLP
jgi:hypothetical protein